MARNIVETFFGCAERQPNHAAILDQADGEVVSYSALREAVERAALVLKRAHVSRGSSIGLHVPSGRNYIILTYAAWLCDAVVVPIATELSPEEKAQVGHDICLTHLISSSASRDNAISFAGLLASHRFLETGVGDTFVAAVHPTAISPAGLAATEPAFIRFTSGTTATAKGVVLSHDTIRERIHAANEVLRLGADDRVVWLMSMSYHFTVSIVGFLAFGATIVLCRNHFGSTIVDAVNQHQATVIYGAPTHYGMMASDTSGASLDNVRLAISTSMATGSQVNSRFHRRFGRYLNETYGIIELGLPFVNVEGLPEKVGSVGRILPAYRLQLDDVGLGPQLKSIRIGGDRGLVDAYYHPWRSREAILNGGYFDTGDLGMMDEDGYLFIAGRTKEVLNVGGMKVFLGEVEAVLESHPAISEACVFAAPDRHLAEIPHAKVVLSPSSEPPTETGLRDFCAERLAKYKIPERFFFVDKLERTASGKLIRSSS